MAEEYVTKAEVLKLLQEQELRFLKMMLVREQLKDKRKF